MAEEEINRAARALFVKEARKIIDRIESGECELTAADAMAALTFLGREAISREEAADLSGEALSTFAEKVKRGQLPQPKKRRGFKEKIWYKGELLAAIFRNKKRK